MNQTRDRSPLRRLLSVAFLAAFVAVSVLPCAAQLDRGTLTGVVTDPTGAAVVGAKVQAVHQLTNMTFETETSMTGNYTLPGLELGRYRVTVEAKGFKRAVFENIEINAGATVRLDAGLQLGAVTETVEVSAQAAAIQTDSTRVSTNITTKLVEDLPLVVAGQIRSVFNLALVAPEVKSDYNYRLGGGQGSAWEMAMDGTSTTSASVQYQTERTPLSTVPVDAIAEFTVETSGMKAEFGRSMGVVSFATRSGTNEFHGNVFDFLRNNAFDARGFFAQSAPVLKQNDFGATLGGPVVLPKLYDGKNKTFFFASYEGFRNRAGSSPWYGTVPLVEMYDGDFSNYKKSGVGMMQLYDPDSTVLLPDGKTYSRTPFSGNQIPKSRFSKVASNYIALRPKDMVPNVPGAGITNNYFRDRGMRLTPWDKYSVRMDHQPNVGNRFSFLWMDGKMEEKFGEEGAPGLPKPFNGTNTWVRKNRSGRFSWDYTISPRVFNSFRVAIMREAGNVTALTCLDPNAKWGAKLGLKNTPGPDQCLPGYGIAGITGWGGNAWGYDRGKNRIITNDVIIVTGQHSLKTGFFWNKDEWWGGGQHRPNGSFDFNIAPTAFPGDGSGNTGSGFASFLLGKAYQWGLETPRAVIQTYHYYGGYLQDDWRLTPKLTMNLGVRWEYTGPLKGGAVLGLKDWTDFGSYGKPAGFMNFNPTMPNPKLGGRPGTIIYTGKCDDWCTGSDYIFKTYKDAIAPRLGLAYQIRNGLVLRAYGGVMYGAVKTTGGSTHFQGLILNATYNNSSLPAYTYFNIDDGLPPWTPPPFRSPITDLGGVTYYWQEQDAGRPPQYYSWNFDIQKQLPGNMVASASYSGTRGVHLSSAILNINQMDPKYFWQYGRDLLNASITSPAAVAAGIPVPYPGFTGTVAQALKPYPQWSDVQTSGGQPSSIGERAGNSTYHAMVLKLDKRYSSGLTLLASYVLSKMFSDADAAYIGVSQRAMDHYNRRLEKALSWSDQTHDLRFAFSYDLPFGKGRHWSFGGPLDYALGGWGISGMLEYGSGGPMSVSPGLTSVPGGAGNRVFINSYTNWRAPVKGEKFDPFVDVWWNKAAFGVDATGRQMTNTELLYAGFGNASRNNPKERAPWNMYENVSLAKKFDFTERINVMFRAEAFNLLNRVRWGGPDSTVTSPSFGQVRSQANDPRRMQLALRINF